MSCDKAGRAAKAAVASRDAASSVLSVISSHPLCAARRFGISGPDAVASAMFVAPSRRTIQPIGITCNFISNAKAGERSPEPARPALMTRTLKDGSRRDGCADTPRRVGTICSTQVGLLGASLRLWSGQWRTPLPRKEELTPFARSQFAREDLLRVIDKILRHLVSCPRTN